MCSVIYFKLLYVSFTHLWKYILMYNINKICQLNMGRNYVVLSNQVVCLNPQSDRNAINWCAHLCRSVMITALRLPPMVQRTCCSSWNNINLRVNTYTKSSSTWTYLLRNIETTNTQTRDVINGLLHCIDVLVLMIYNIWLLHGYNTLAFTSNYPF